MFENCATVTILLLVLSINVITLFILDNGPTIVCSQLRQAYDAYIPVHWEETPHHGNRKVGDPLL